jgi:hypothetical protein
VKQLLVFCFIIFIYVFSFAAQKAKIIGDYVEIYESADFDSEVIEEVYKGEVYLVSKKNFGPFYKIKLKNGEIGYIVDYQLDFVGKGPLKPKDFDQLESLADQSLEKNIEEFKNKRDSEEEEFFGTPTGGPFLMFINYHEKTMGSEQVDDLLAFGYKANTMVAWSLMTSMTAPKYYRSGTGRSASGFKIWGDVGFSNEVAKFGDVSSLYFSGRIFTHLSSIRVQTPVQKYDLQDVTAGFNVEMTWMRKFKKMSTDISLKYFFDKSNYAGIGVGILF